MMSLAIVAVASWAAARTGIPSFCPMSRREHVRSRRIPVEAVDAGKRAHLVHGLQLQPSLHPAATDRGGGGVLSSQVLGRDASRRGGSERRDPA
jgi:hypothetical protein